MLTLLNRAARRSQFCDGISRRDFLIIGGTVAGGLSLPSLLRAEAKQGVRSSHKALINIFLPGGPPHQDMWDMKPEAPAEIRGEFKPISTKVPGIQVCELLPKIAAMMDKFAVIRSIVDSRGPHFADQCMSPGLLPNSPSLGAWVSRIQGPACPDVPANLSLFYRTSHAPWGTPGVGGFLGASHAAYGLVDKYDPGFAAKTTKELAPDPGQLVLHDVTLDRLKGRLGLLQKLDAHRSAMDSSPLKKTRDQFVEQAWSILASPRLVDALDISKEDPKIVERYGKGVPEYNADSAPRVTENFLVARRLVEAGARVVSLNFSRWDWHGSNFAQGRTEFPLLDNAVTALVQDLYDRGMEKDVSVVVWGEFGRTPTINKDAGRDHWPRVNSALLAGGGMRTGQVIGATDKQAGEVIDRPVKFGEIHATLLHNMGIDPHQAIPDAEGRIQRPVLAETNPIPELVG